MPLLARCSLILLLMIPHISYAGIPPTKWKEDGTTLASAPANVDCQTGVTCTKNGGTIEVDAGVPTSITVADTTDSTSFFGLYESATGDLAPKTDGGATYNASTGASTFGGTVTAGGTDQSTLTEGLVVNNGNGTDEDDDFTVKASGGTWEVDAGAGTFIGTTNDSGWKIVDQTDNQACTTGCTSACVFGVENATGTAVTNLVSCDATTSDLCLCAGAS